MEKKGSQVCTAMHSWGHRGHKNSKTPHLSFLASPGTLETREAEQGVVLSSRIWNMKKYRLNQNKWPEWVYFNTPSYFHLSTALWKAFFQSFPDGQMHKRCYSNDWCTECILELNINSVAFSRTNFQWFWRSIFLHLFCLILACKTSIRFLLL